MVLCFALTLGLSAQRIHFDVILFGDKVGDLTVTKTLEPENVEHYTLETHSAAKILWINRENESRYDVKYQNGKLISSSHIEKQNGRLERWTKVHFDGQIYQVDSYKGKRSFTEAPDFSIVTLYFEPRKLHRKIFYEAEADFNELKYPDANTMEFKSSDGNRNVYHYENGHIHDMEFHVSIATVYMRRTN